MRCYWNCSKAFLLYVSHRQSGLIVTSIEWDHSKEKKANTWCLFVWVCFSILKDNQWTWFHFYIVYNIGSAKKKTTEYFRISLFFYFKVQSFRLIVENNFIQMAASACHAVAYTIGPFFKHRTDCVQLHFTNGFTNIVL